MKNLISNVLGINSFVILNKTIIKALGMHESVLLSFLVDKWSYFNHADFYYTIQDLTNDTDLSERECRNIMRKLVDKGILIKKAFGGIPPKQYYNINQDAIIEIFKNPIHKKNKKDSTLPNSNPFKNEIDNPCKNERVDTCKNESVVHIYNNKEIKNKEFITNIREKNEKNEKKQKSENLFFYKEDKYIALNSQKQDFFSEKDFTPSDDITKDDLKHLNAFSMILEKSSIARELKRELGLFILMRKDLGAKGKLTNRSLQMILSKLESFKNTNARRQALENSIINNWVGIFNPQTSNQNKESNAINSYERPKPSDEEMKEFERKAIERGLNPEYSEPKETQETKGIDDEIPF